jgi:hypothetical protein
MCGVAGQEYPCGSVPVGDALVDPEPGSPDHVRHLHCRTTWSPGVEQPLRKGDVGLFGRIVDLGHEPERSVRERCHDQHAWFGEEQQDLGSWKSAIDAHVCEREGQRKRIVAVVPQSG